MKSRGFTLLELLVVISIIGILVAIAAVSFSTAQKQGRDSRRRQDIKALQNAFEQYNAKNNGVYDLDCDTMLVNNLQGPPPTDPQTGVSYTSTASCTLTAYCVCALIESNGGGNSTDGSCTYADAGTEQYWCASSLQ